MANIEQGGSANLSPILNGVNILPYSIVGTGTQTVVTSGVAVQLATTTPTTTITVRANVSNSGLIFIGGPTVDSSTGFQLSASETVSIDLDNLSKLWIDAASSGDGVSYIYLAS